MQTEKVGSTATVTLIKGAADKNPATKGGKQNEPFGIHQLPFEAIEAIRELKNPGLEEYLFLRLGHKNHRRYSQTEAAKELKISEAECERREREGMKKISRGLPNEIMERLELTLDATPRPPTPLRAMSAPPSRPAMKMPIVEHRRPQLASATVETSPLAHSVPAVENDIEPKLTQDPAPTNEQGNAILLEAFEKILNDALTKHCVKPDDSPIHQMLEALAKNIKDMQGKLDELAERVGSAPTAVETEPKAPVVNAPIEEPRAEMPDKLVDALDGIATALTKQADGFGELSQFMRNILESREKPANKPTSVRTSKAKPKRQKAKASVQKAEPPKAPEPILPPPLPSRHQVGDDGTVKVGRKIYVTVDAVGKEYEGLKPWRVRDILRKSNLHTVLGMSRRGTEATLYQLVEARRALDQYLKTVAP